MLCNEFMQQIYMQLALGHHQGHISHLLLLARLPPAQARQSLFALQAGKEFVLRLWAGIYLPTHGMLCAAAE